MYPTFHFANNPNNYHYHYNLSNQPSQPYNYPIPQYHLQNQNFNQHRAQDQLFLNNNITQPTGYNENKPLTFYNNNTLFYNRSNVNGTDLNHENQTKKTNHNYYSLAVAVPGDLLEYVEQEDNLVDRYYVRKYALFMGNDMIARYDINNKIVIYESYWNIGYNYFIFVNRELDKKYFTLPLHVLFNRAILAIENKTNEQFNSDKNFVMWCKYDVNKSDIEAGFELPKSNKDFLLKKYLDSLNEAEDLN